MWLHKGEQFFRAYGTPDHLKVSTASFYLEAAASQWYYKLEKNQGAPTWPQFVDAINRRFGTPLRSNPLGELTHLCRTTTVDEYQEKFLLFLARCEGVTEAQQIAIFTAGLQQPLHRRGTTETRNYRSLSTPATPAAPAKPELPADSRFKRLSPEEMAQRRLEGLCFSYLEKFSKEHAKQCTGKGIYFLELDTDALASEDGGSDDDLQISVAAITGTQSSATLHLSTVVCDKAVVALVDSGSTHSFIDGSTARRLGLVPSPRPGLVVGVANGDRVAVSGVCKAVRFAIGTEEFVADFFVIPLGGVDMVLGCDWLRTMVFWWHDRRVSWSGMRPTSAMVTAGADKRDYLLALLDEFADLFAEPKGLPPARSFDHRIHLLPGTPPVAVRPYRYAQLLKDEIKAQCQAMLAQGIIRPSTSAFSSPVLLIHKGDGSWRFCVDYRALNSKTVRDLFPIPVVEELLDELKGAVFFY
ncbi:uncharacterized protein LOC120695058 [Panicum virgatum]|uniref:uncharacterized protein LOC120695058 n=1 Tax=Panicum virgatum TaxID=38727 RepID=UPI0019D538CE|nr:uncharacterized protein LOC120695058 [Panicum virgatum]